MKKRYIMPHVKVLVSKLSKIICTSFEINKEKKSSTMDSMEFDFDSEQYADFEE